MLVVVIRSLFHFLRYIYHLYYIKIDIYSDPKILFFLSFSLFNLRRFSSFIFFFLLFFQLYSIFISLCQCVVQMVKKKSGSLDLWRAANTILALNSSSLFFFFSFLPFFNNFIIFLLHITEYTSHIFLFLFRFFFFFQVPLFFLFVVMLFDWHFFFSSPFPFLFPSSFFRPPLPDPIFPKCLAWKVEEKKKGVWEKREEEFGAHYYWKERGPTPTTIDKHIQASKRKTGKFIY